MVEKSRTGRENDAILVDAGDFSMGTLFHTSFMQEGSELRLMGQMGYDAITFGNHDFDFRPEGLAKALRAAKGKAVRLPKIVASNTVFADKDGDASLKSAFQDFPVEEFTILTRNGVRIGIFGLMGKVAADDAPSSDPVSFADPVESGRRMADILRNREKADVIVCLSHSGTSPIPKYSEDEILARKVPEIDVIISGHTHTVLPKPIVAGKTVIASAGCYGSHLGSMEFEFVRGKGVKLLSYRLDPVAPGIPDDPAVAAEIRKFKKIVEREYLLPRGYRFDQVIAESPFDMESLDSLFSRPREAGIGNLIADAFRSGVKKAEGRRYEHVHLAIVPYGYIRDSFTRGPQTADDVFRVLSLGLGPDGTAGSPLVAYYIRGKEVKDLLEVETTLSSSNPDAHLQASGVRFTFNPNRMPFDRVDSVFLQDPDGRYLPADPERLYRISMNFNIAKMIDYVRKKSHGLMGIVPKDREGRPLADLNSAVIYEQSGSGKRELKDWQALADYMGSFPRSGGGIPGIPAGYGAPEGRIVSTASWNPVDLVRGGNAITWGALLVLVVLAAAAAFTVRKIILLRRR